MKNYHNYINSYARLVSAPCLMSLPLAAQTFSVSTSMAPSWQSRERCEEQFALIKVALNVNILIADHSRGPKTFVLPCLVVLVVVVVFLSRRQLAPDWLGPQSCTLNTSRETTGWHEIVTSQPFGRLR